MYACGILQIINKYILYLNVLITLKQIFILIKSKFSIVSIHNVIILSNKLPFNILKSKVKIIQNTFILFVFYVQLRFKKIKLSIFSEIKKKKLQIY